MMEASLKDSNTIDAGTRAASEADLMTNPVSLLARWNVEILSLYGKRMQEYCMMPLNLSLCTSADDFKDFQDKFCATLQADYGATAEKLTQAVADSDNDTDSGESYASVLLAAQEDARAIIEQARAQASRIIEDAELRTQAPATERRTSQAA